MSRILFACAGGRISLPDRRLVLVSREDGGNLVVLPPREVWERSELAADELTHWSFLVAAAGHAMLATLPQLDGGCINYWEAGNWALNDAAEPPGPKRARDFRSVHLHLLGRSRTPKHAGFVWGEAPKFPEFAQRHDWASGFERLRAEECSAIIAAVESRLRSHYGLDGAQVGAWSPCPGCGYPAPANDSAACQECRS